MMLGDHDRTALRDIARASIRHGLAADRALTVDPAALAAALREPGAAFVTLKLAGALRGCIGSLEARRPLALDVAENAFASAFRDPRFAPLARAEEAELDLHISVLSEAEPVPVRSEAELLASLRPGIDGVILSAGARRGTFLPSVWEQLPEPHRFLAQLRRKAGLPADYWSAELRVERYTVEAF